MSHSARPPRLSRSTSDRVFAGILGGIARWSGWSSTPVRMGYIVLSVLSAAFPGLVVYVVLWLLLPEGD